MLEELSQRARFRQWLQAVASGEVSEYPEPSDLPRDARIMLETEDSVRRELRQMRNDVGVLRKRLAELAEADAARALDAVFDAARDFSATYMAAHPFMLSIELREIDPELSRKVSSIRDYLPPDMH